MAVDRLPQIAPSPTTPARDVRRAQQAFFQAALGKVQGAPAAGSPSVSPATSPAQASAPAQAGSEPKAGYRPGSLLDIKI